MKEYKCIVTNRVVLIKEHPTEPNIFRVFTTDEDFIIEITDDILKNQYIPLEDYVPLKAQEYFEEVNKPQHYHKGGVDVIDFLTPKVSKERTAGFYQYNVIKYVTRYLDKGTPIKDLEKAQYYLRRLKRLEKEEE